MMPVAQKPPIPPVAKTHTIPAPIGGLNARDPYSAMPETDAVSLVNWIPDTGGIKSRKGYSEWAINFPGGKSVNTIFGYIPPGTTYPGGSFLTDPTTMPGKLFAATDTAIYDITGTTNAPTSSYALSGASNAGWMSTTQFTNSGGAYSVCCSETDGYLYYDGTTWNKPTMGTGTGQIAGIDPGKFVFGLSFKNRLWFVERNSTRAWYLAPSSITGTANLFDFGAYFEHGGNLEYLARWTIDAGEGIDDYFVAVGSNGDVLVYQGADPSSISTWALVGTWYIGQVPVGRRAFVQYGGDLILISGQGVYPISYVTRGGADFLQASAKEYSSKIRPLIGKDLSASFTTRGWQALVHPTERTMLINVPNYGAQNNRQYAMSTTQNSWCIFQNIPIYSIGTTAGFAFAGTVDGRVLLLFNGYQDDVPYAGGTGAAIYGQIIPAFSYLSSPAQQKFVSLVRPCFLAAAPPNVTAGVNTNFDINNTGGTPAYTAPTTSTWDSAHWDSAVWSGAVSVYATWIGAGAIGFSASLAMTTATVADTTLTAIDYVYTPGGVL